MKCHLVHVDLVLVYLEEEIKPKTQNYELG